MHPEYICGSMDIDPGVGYNYDAWVAKLKPTINPGTGTTDPNAGDTIWTNRLDGTGEDKALSLDIDETDHAYVTGYITNASGNKDIFINEYATNPNVPFVTVNPLPSTSYNGASNLDDVGNQIVVTPATNVLVVGYSTGTISQEDFITFKYVNFIPTADAGPDKTICLNDSVRIGGSLTGDTYQWSPSAGLSDTTVLNPWASPSSQTVYHLTLTSGCAQAYDSLTVNVNPIPPVPTIIRYGDTLKVISNLCYTCTYSWNRNNNTIVSATDSIYIIGSQTGSFSFEQTLNIDNCPSISNTITITGINDIALDDFNIYPNPATNELFIQTGNLPVGQVNIYNEVGSLVSQTKQPANNRIDISRLAKGVYIAEVKVRDAVQRERWVKM